jgi:hypothetical protein
MLDVPDVAPLWQTRTGPELYSNSNYPERFEDMLTDQRVEDWLVEKWRGSKYTSAQAITFWRHSSTHLREELVTKLLHKAIGEMNDYPTPQSFIRVFRSLLETRKLSVARKEEVYELGTARLGQIVTQTPLRSGVTEPDWKKWLCEIFRMHMEADSPQ